MKSSFPRALRGGSGAARLRGAHTQVRAFTPENCIVFKSKNARRKPATWKVRPPSARLNLEALEDRCLLSGWTQLTNPLPAYNPASPPYDGGVMLLLPNGSV